MKYLTEFGAQKLLKDCRFRVSLPRVHLAKTEKEAAKFAAKTGYPLVLKVMSQDILHKSNAGGVKIVNSPGELAKSYSGIIKNAKKYNYAAKIDGVLVEEFLQGTELIIGAKKDAQFGPVILFGIGGIFVEIMKDVSIRLIPITRNDAKEMIHEIRGHKLLYGYRGKKPANLDAIEDALMAVSDLVSKHPEIQEMDINPLFANEKGVVVGDARIALG